MTTGHLFYIPLTDILIHIYIAGFVPVYIHFVLMGR